MLPDLIPFTPLALVLLMAWRQWPGAREGRVVAAEVERHRAVLRGKWLRAHDEYGSFDRADWEDDVAYFVDSVIVPRLRRAPSERAHARLVRRTSRAALHEFARAEASLDEALRQDPIAPAQDPVLFEHRCADILKARGWDARTVGGSGDQGADVIATAAGRTLVVQCKRWSKPIGNKAVQEATSARSFYRADMAAVVGTAPFTPAAYELADATDVMLLDEAGLAALEPPA